MSYSGQKFLGVDFARKSTALEHKLGERLQDDEGREWVYIQAQGAVGAGVPVKAAAGFDCPPAGNAGVIYGVAETAFADNEYGWVIVKGKVTDAQAATTVTNGAQLARVADANGDVVAVGAATGATLGVALEDDTAGLADILIF